MSESSRRQSAVEIFPPAWQFPAAASWLAGWIHAPAGDAVTDVRAWLDERPFLGLHGLPRPGFDEKFNGRAGPPYGGFSFLLAPQRGSTRLRLEACDLAGRWTEFFRTDISIAPDAGPLPSPSALAPQLQQLIPALLQRAIRQPERSLSALAAETLAAVLAEPLNALPNLPFVGALEEPALTGRVRHGRLSVTGWLAHPAARITRLTAVLDPLRETALPHGLARPELAGKYPPGSGAGAFVGQIDLPAGLSSPVLLKIFAELDNGEKHLAFAQRFRPEILAGADRPSPPVSGWRFAQAVCALTCSARQHSVPTVGTCRAAREAWANYPARLRATAGRAPPAKYRQRQLRILVVTHNLNFEGAPRLVLELATFLSRQPGIEVRVISPHDGSLRALFEAAGIPVTVLDLAPTFGAMSAADFHATLEPVGRAIDWHATDLVLANTMVSFWAVPLARAAGKPSLLYVHESAPIERLFTPLVSPVLFPVIEEAFRTATRVAFTADASRQIFARLDHGHFRVLPSWLDFAAVDAFVSSHPKATLQARHGFAPDSILLLNLGTVCERKGQHVFLRAAEFLAAELATTYPGRPVIFLMVGAREDEFLVSLRAQVAAAALQNVRFVPETRENFAWHRLADILVCTSFEESSPRVLIEAAAFGTPIVSTDVNGIPELVAGSDAWLVAPGDPYHLAAAIRHALAAFVADDTSRPERARRSAARRFDERVSLPRHLALASEAVAAYS
ncbi:MAG: glycosyltransferase family 4 protein [Opitutae bacterium]|nr:glycosyltransferase family 4 protein [Opitutae bacterium]